MTRKNETMVLILALFIALGLLGIGAWLVKNFVLEENPAPPIVSKTPVKPTSPDVSAQKSPTRQDIQQALSASDFSTTGAAGTIQFLPSGDRNAPVQLVEIVPSVNSNTGYDFVPVRQ